ncbi:flagella basal body P-ring formation protein FlgA [Opitutaceae bacterium TAV1]|nr:flagella basal body P-ring formation protein FlgA [Opitutaceae bacterium TAV1]
MPDAGRSRRLAALVFALVLPAASQTSSADDVAGTAPPAPSATLLRRLADDIAAHFQASGELLLDWQRPQPALAGLAPDAALRILEYPAALAPQMLVRVRLPSAPRQPSDPARAAPPPADITLVVRAQLWRDGWLLPEPAARGDPVLPSALGIKRFDALRDRDAVPADSGADLLFARALPAGRLLVWRDVIRRPLVRRGQSVEISAGEGALLVTLRGIAMEDAGRGETVRIRNPESRKEFTALVVSESRAEVRF